MAGIYIHIPFCRQKCSYCDFVSFPDKIGYAEAYMACVYKELKMRGEELKGRTFDTVYFGGGTPSYIPPKLILGAMNRIRESFTLSDNAEITLELNPGTIGEEKVKIYEKAGINRFSVGLQTAIDSQLEDIGRIHNVHDYVYATKLLKGKNFSTDVMLGLKNQTKADIKKTIELAAACGSSHISMYALTVEDGTPIYTDYLNGELLRITEEWPSEREHQGESMLMPYLSYSKEHRYFYRIALANRNMLPVQKIFKPLWEKLVLPKCQMAGILQNCIPSF